MGEHCRERFCDPENTREAQMRRIVEEYAACISEDRRPQPDFWDWLQAFAAQCPGKQPGTDGVVPEMLRNLPLRAKIHLAKIMGDRLEGGLHVRPKRWEEIYLQGIPKERSSRELDKWKHD